MRSRFNLGLILTLLALSGCDCANGDQLGEFTPELRLSPSEIDFGEVSVGAAGLATLNIINDGTGPIEIISPLGIEAAAFTIVLGDEDALPVAAGEFGVVELAFAPLEVGPFTGELVLPFRDPLVEVRVPVRGEGLPNPIRFDPLSVDLGEVNVGDEVSGAANVINEGEVAVELVLSMRGRGFTIDGNTTMPISLAPGEVRPLDLRFAPPRGGVVEGTLIAEVCGSGCGPALALTGLGLAPRIAVTPRPVDFGEVPLGEERELELTIANDGVGVLTVSSALVTGADPRVEVTLPDPPFEIAAGESVLASISYQASEPEAQLNANIVISSDDPLSPEVGVPVTASTPGAALRVIPGVLNFGLVSPDETRALDIVIRSSGTDAITLDAVEITDDPTGAFELNPAPTLPVALAGGGSQLVSLLATANPAVVQALTGRATVVVRARDGQDNLLEATASLELTSGTAACDPHVALANVNLGFVQLGQGSRGSVFIENRGTQTCTLTRILPAPGLPFDPGFTFRADAIASLAPGDISEVEFAFNAANAGAASAVLSLEYDAALAPLLVSATAYGVLGALAPVPPVLELGPVAVGCEVRPRVMTFINDGGGSVTVSEFTLESDLGPFSITAQPQIVQPGRGAIVSLGAEALAIGVHQRDVVATTEELGEVGGIVRLIVTDPDDPIEESFVTPSIVKADVLFVVDNSGSMSDDQDRLATNFERFIEVATGAGGVDFHIGLTSTDVLNPDGAGGRLLGSPKVLSNSTSNIESRFAERARLGTSGTPIELGLEAMRQATTEPLLSSANSGFLRPDALLSIVMVTDEDDSGPFLQDSTLNLPPDAYIGHLEALKGGSLDHVPVVFSLVGPGFADRYQELVDYFGGVRLNIGSPDWGEQLGDLGDATFSASRTFRLSNDPRAGTVTVSIDGVPTGAFVRSGRSIRLDAAPPPGARVTVSYLPDC